MSKWTHIRDAIESIGSVAGNYFLPGSSILTDRLVSKGAQKNLHSPLGQLFNVGSGLVGGGFGSDFTGIPASGGYTGAANSIGGFFGDPTLGTDIGNGISDLGHTISNGFSDAGNNISNGVSSLFDSPTADGFGQNADVLQGFNGGATPDIGTNIGREAISSGAQTPAPNLTGYTPGTGASSVGGGSSGGFADFGTPASSGSSYGDTLGNQFNQVSSGFENAPGFNVPTGGTNPSLALGGKSMGLSDLFSGGNQQMLNGILRTLTNYAGNDTNQKGYQGEANAANAAGQLYQPFYESGMAANKTLADLYGTNGPEAAASAQKGWQNTPGYQFTRGQGINALDASAAAKGNLLSGNQTKAVQDYGTGLANQYYNQYIQQLQDQARQGQSAAGGVGSGMTGAANFRAQGSQANANRNNQLWGGLSGAAFPGNDLMSFLQGNYGSGGLASLWNH